MNSSREKMTLWMWLSVFALMILLAGYEYLRNGPSAIAIILTLFSILVAAKLSHLIQRSHKKLAQVIEAMANDDPTLGLNQTTPLAKKLAQVSEQISQNRKKANHKRSFYSRYYCT